MSKKIDDFVLKEKIKYANNGHRIKKQMKQDLENYYSKLEQE